MKTGIELIASDRERDVDIVIHTCLLSIALHALVLIIVTMVLF